VDLLLEEAGARDLSKYERHMAVIEQLAPNIFPAELTPEDRGFLIG
jgi:hypothetical protein